LTGQVTAGRLDIKQATLAVIVQALAQLIVEHIAVGVIREGCAGRIVVMGVLDLQQLAGIIGYVVDECAPVDYLVGDAAGITCWLNSGADEASACCLAGDEKVRY